MSAYKWLNTERTMVLRYPHTQIAHEGEGWARFVLYQNGGGVVDPYRTTEEWVQASLSFLKTHYESLTMLYEGAPEQNKKGVRLFKSLRKEVKGQASPKDVALLNENDLIDSWFCSMEQAMEGANHGKQWIEDPIRTEQELIDYDPTLVSWPDYPVH